LVPVSMMRLWQSVFTAAAKGTPLSCAKGRDLLEQAGAEGEEPLLLRLNHRTVLLVPVLEHRHGGDPVGALLHERADLHPGQPAQPDVEPASRESDLLLDDPGAGQGEEIGAAVVAPLPARPEEGHGDHPVAAQRILHHQAVARLEDVQGERGVRKEDQIGQGEDRYRPPRSQALQGAGARIHSLGSRRTCSISPAAAAGTLFPARAL